MRRTSWIAAALALSMLQGCAGGGSRIAALAGSATALDVLAGGAALYAVYTFSQTPSWKALASASENDPTRVDIELEKSMFSQGGDGAASMVFRMAAKKWCMQRGSKDFETMEFIEFYEPRLVGAARKAKGEARCL